MVDLIFVACSMCDMHRASRVVHTVVNVAVYFKGAANLSDPLGTVSESLWRNVPGLVQQVPGLVQQGPGGLQQGPGVVQQALGKLQ